MAVNRIHTPCIGFCSTVFGDTVCRGCCRFSHEVVHWNGYTNEEKQIVWKRLNLLLCQVVDNYFVVTDAARLAAEMDFQNLRYQTQLSPQGWVPELLKAAGKQQIPYDRFGLRALPPSRGLLPRELYDQISAECHALARAHYDRSYARPVTLAAELTELAAREKGLI